MPLRAGSTVVLFATLACAVQANDLRIDLKLLSHRTLTAKSIAEILRSAQVEKPYKFQVQKISELSPPMDGNRRVSICYWLGDVQYVDENAACGIGFIFDEKTDKWIADPNTRDLSDPMLSGESAFNLALDIKYGKVCGSDLRRENRKC